MYVGTVLLGLVWLIIRWRCGAAAWPKIPLFRFRWLIPACSLSAIALFVAELWIIDFQARHQIGSLCWLHLPIPVVGDFDQYSGGQAMLIPSAVFAICAVAQALVLACMYLAAAERQLSAWEKRIIGAAFACGITAAILSPAMTSSDTYHYILYAKVGFASFAVAPHVIAASDIPVRLGCFHLLLPSAYGPAFIAYVRTLLAAIHQPIAAIIMLRATNALWLMGAIACLRRMGVAPSIAALFAINPVVLLEYVTNAHNDVIPLCLIAAAMVLDATVPLASTLIVVLAGLFKLPFLAIGALVFAERSSVRGRVMPAVISTVLALVLSYAWAGPAYFGGLTWLHSVLAVSSNHPVPVMIVTLVAFVAIGSALVLRTYNGVAAFSFPALATAAVQPWYAPWGLPYALREKRHLALFLALMPIAALLMDKSISYPVQFVLYCIVCVAITALALRDMLMGKRSL